jgi:tRNA nucleotidyltransferase (CCA-adding enzyme)
MTIDVHTTSLITSALKGLAIDHLVDGLEVYIVGGAVRDALLGMPAGDRDWVVVGSTPEEMARRGFIPVGGDFPVFLHPKTKEEYALARTERKSGRGYKGFTFYTGADVTLPQDLERRDLTVNAIACTPTGVLHDPLNGIKDVQARVLRHVGMAFAEDPVRILRLGRFSARFSDFSVADETLALCRSMVEAGEADALVPERVWKELSRGLLSLQPSRMLDVLERCGALSRVMPELQEVAQVGQDLDRAAANKQIELPGRYALLCRLTDAKDALNQRLRVPTECADYARLLPKLLSALGETDPDSQLMLIEQTDGLRKPDRLIALLDVVALVSDVDIPAWRHRLNVVRAVDAGAIAKQCARDPQGIKAAVRAARLAALTAL